MEAEPTPLLGFLPLPIWTNISRQGAPLFDGNRSARSMNQVMPWRFIFL
jgi:hypothetical protein